jgi:purine catabolism regulator
MKLIEAMQLPSLQRARIVAGAKGAHNTIRLVNAVDLPDPLPWVTKGDFLLTTGFAWPSDDAEQRKLIYDLAGRGLSAVGMAVPHYFEEIPASARIAAEELQFPLIEIPWEVPFYSITEEILNSIVMVHYKQKEQSETIHRELMRIAVEAKSLKEITNTMGKLIGKSLIVQHPEGPVLASYAMREEGNLDASYSIDNEHLPQRLASFLREHKSMFSSRSKSQLVQISAHPDFGLPERYVCPIHLEHELVGLLWVFHPSLNEWLVPSIEYSALVVALHISRQRALVSLEAQLGYSFLDALFEGKFHSSAQTVHRAELLGYDSEESYSVCMAILDVSIPMSREGIMKREQLSERLKRGLQELKASSVLSFVQNQIFFLLPERIPAELLWQKIKALDISLAVSLAQRGFERVVLGYKEVNSIMKHLKFGQMHYYNDLLVPRVLRGDDAACSLFLDQLFSPIQSSKNSEVLMMTLLAFIRQGFHQKATAHVLNIHPKSLRYRLNHVTALTSMDLEDPETQFQLQLASKIMSFSS